MQPALVRELATALTPQILAEYYAVIPDPRRAVIARLWTANAQDFRRYLEIAIRNPFPSRARVPGGSTCRQKTLLATGHHVGCRKSTVAGKQGSKDQAAGVRRAHAPRMALTGQRPRFEGEKLPPANLTPQD